MTRFPAAVQVHGESPLMGDVVVSSAKNAVLPVLAASLLSDERSTVLNVPDIGDVSVFTQMAREAGASCIRTDNSVSVASGMLNFQLVPARLYSRIRYSSLLMGVAVALRQPSFFPAPGGCYIGPRPIDIHLDCFRAMGVRVTASATGVWLEPQKPRSAHVKLRFPSVTATENALIAASMSAGAEVVLENAAIEPEIIDLVGFLRGMGAQIRLIGDRTFLVKGVRRLRGNVHTCIPDRIEAMTYAIAAAVTGGEIVVHNVCPEHMHAPIEVLRRMGVSVVARGTEMKVTATPTPQPTVVATGVYPGFPTDLQPVLMPLLLKCEGPSLVHDRVFPHRFAGVSGLRCMGAHIAHSPAKGSVVLHHTPRLEGTTVEANDIRAGAALLVAALGASGTTVIRHAQQLTRGYDDPLTKIRGLGGDVKEYVGCRPTPDAPVERRPASAILQPCLVGQ